MNSKNCWMPSTRAVKEGIAPGSCGIPAETWNIHGGMKLAFWIFSGVRNSVPKPGSNKNTQQPIFHVLRELFTWLAAVPYAGVSPGAYKELRILSSSLLDYGWSATFKGNSRVIGWISFWPLTLTCTTRTCQSWCGKITIDRLEHFDRQGTQHSVGDKSLVHVSTV